MNSLRLPFFEALARARTVLVAGAGGGFDVFAGLPLFFALREEGKAVHLANLSFSDLSKVPGPRLAPGVARVTADPTGHGRYAPEHHLAAWFEARGEPTAIHCFERTGVRPIRDAYRALVSELGIDTVLLVDGGTDSLLRGDESDLGTPEEDVASLLAVRDLAVETKLLASVGFGIDAFHGVCHVHVLEAIADLARAGGYLGAFSLTREMACVGLYREATESVLRAMPEAYASIVNGSLLSALAGDFGDVHSSRRTEGSELFVNPLMPIVWTFELEAVARRLLYPEALAATETYADLVQGINAFRAGLPALRAARPMPL